MLPLLSHAMSQQKTEKRQSSPVTGHEGSEGEYRYSFTSSLMSALDGGEGVVNAMPWLLYL